MLSRALFRPVKDAGMVSEVLCAQQMLSQKAYLHRYFEKVPEHTGAHVEAEGSVEQQGMRDRRSLEVSASNADRSPTLELEEACILILQYSFLKPLGIVNGTGKKASDLPRIFIMPYNQRLAY